MRGPGPSERELRERMERHYRSHVREIGEIAAHALASQGERRATALADISRLSAKALREGAGA